ncbi:MULTISPECIES: PIN domain-containing protein [Metallosphaera]|uniref:PIN domain-containing protein n=1 Tax=Metallosphaera TaxID=41980 RepID=UPI001F0622B4|nr:PIN domain-containing protein [Metallosphaera sedula]MCH1770382.1 PIN domain-containing protein [Metallosphaera sedula]MCP6727784.1 PIN domain-containing protein [Metallosphaera sedula]
MQRTHIAVVDTNVLVYDLVENSPFHMDARERLNKLDAVVLLPNILVEFILVTSVKLKMDQEIVKGKVEEILRNSVIARVTRRDFKTVLGLHLNMREINDHLLVAVAKRLKLPVLSYDSDVINLCTRFGVETI